MATTIEVNKQNIKELLTKGKEHPFIIPEYQRPYEWEEDQVQTLFDDLWEFFSNKTNEDSKYFLGSIIYFENSNGEQEIIDGQQRITSLFLLLRAIYTSLENATKTKEVENFIKEIEPTIWQTNKFTGVVDDFSNILIKSYVVDNARGNEILKNILQTGKADKKSKDNYSKNYIKFQQLFEDASKNNSLMIYNFIYSLLNQTILLPITADGQEMALTIFSTLNNRGLPLSDADIFKAKIYNHLNTEEKKSNFINSWKKLDEEANNVGENIRQLFYYYMFYLRAIEKDTKTTTPGIRRYYFDNNSKRLFGNSLIDDLSTTLNIWKVIQNHEDINEPWTKNIEILQSLDILNSYPNEFWKYPVVVYYLSHRSNPNFENQFSCFLHKLILELLSKYLIKPTINAVKSNILKLNAEIIDNPIPKFDFEPIETSQLKDKIKNPHKNTVRMLLKILAYSKQDELLPTKWEIEHILPQTWQSNYFNLDENSIKDKIEHIGNKIPLEKKINIMASNGYLGKKKKEYAKSNIKIAQELSNFNSDDWRIDDIIERDIRVSDTIIALFNEWNDKYNK